MKIFVTMPKNSAATDTFFTEDVKKYIAERIVE